MSFNGKYWDRSTWRPETRPQTDNINTSHKNWMIVPRWFFAYLQGNRWWGYSKTSGLFVIYLQQRHRSTPSNHWNTLQNLILALIGTMKLDTNNAGAQRPFWFIVSDSMPVTDYALVDPDDDHPKLVMMFPVTMFQNEWRRTSLIHIRHMRDHRLADGTEGCMGSTSGFSSLACWSNLSSPLSFTASWYLMSDNENVNHVS